MRVRRDDMAELPCKLATAGILSRLFFRFLNSRVGEGFILAPKRHRQDAVGRPLTKPEQARRITLPVTGVYQTLPIQSAGSHLLRASAFGPCLAVVTAG